jgi:hypothetical protein
MKRRLTAYQFTLLAVGGAFAGCLVAHELLPAAILFSILVLSTFYEQVLAPADRQDS